MPEQIGHNWLLLRGLSREAAHWGAFLPQMRTMFPGTIINTLDLPGSGGNYQAPSPTNISAIMAQVREQARAQGLLNQPLTILALSMGGMVAWEWALTYPDDVAGAVLVNSSFASLNPFYQRIRWQSFGRFSRILLEKDLYRRERAIIELVCNGRDQDDLLADAWLQIQKDRPVSFENFFRQIMAAASYKPGFAKPKQPILLVNSQADRLVSPDCTLSIGANWNLQVKTHPWAGHDLSIDDGLWLINQLKAWLEPTV